MAIFGSDSFGEKRAFSINPHSDYVQLNFQFANNTEVYHSCSIQWKNNYYIFGGGNIKHQVLMVGGNRLERKADLDFAFSGGGCTVLNQITILLCFGNSKTKFRVCRQSNNPLGSFTKLPNSNHGHWFTRIASFDGKNKIY